MINWSAWAVAGVHEEGFVSGWEDTVPHYPSYRVIGAGGATCLLRRPAAGPCVLRVRLFFHVTRPPLPSLEAKVGPDRWVWELEPGWQILDHVLPPGPEDVTVSFKLLAEGEPWFEARVVEVRLLGPDDPRVVGGTCR